jgi:hypothetical protein
LPGNSAIIEAVYGDNTVDIVTGQSRTMDSFLMLIPLQSFDGDSLKRSVTINEAEVTGC